MGEGKKEERCLLLTSVRLSFAFSSLVPLFPCFRKRKPHTHTTDVKPFFKTTPHYKKTHTKKRSKQFFTQEKFMPALVCALVVVLCVCKVCVVLFWGIFALQQSVRGVWHSPSHIRPIIFTQKPRSTHDVPLPSFFITFITTHTYINTNKQPHSNQYLDTSAFSFSCLASIPFFLSSASHTKKTHPPHPHTTPHITEQKHKQPTDTHTEIKPTQQHVWQPL